MSSGVGKALREARTERGIELSEVERITKIRVKCLQAMEEDRWEVLPAPVYARSFLATYAEFLGLDHRALVEEYTRSVEGADRAEPIPESVIRPGSLRQGHSPMGGRSIKPKPIATVLAALVAAVLLGLAVVGALGGSNGSNGGGHRAEHRGKKTAGATTTTTTTSQPPSGEVSVELRTTADVWTCLVDDDGRALVKGVTLAADEVRGPFSGSGFDVTFGNGSVEMTVDGQPADVPPVASPLGFRITPSGVRKLAPSDQPTCL
jgi:Helix-turn-helix domain/RodZ C-terminal domain